jgi:plasmid stabilization system protein ParE
MSGYVLGVDADSDLDEIWEYIAADNVEAADRWIEKLFAAFESLDLTAAHRSLRSRPEGDDPPCQYQVRQSAGCV